ncbi:hypothetical protein ACHAW6_001147 [Cyclotella cf. meneghiniana]
MNVQLSRRLASFMSKEGYDMIPSIVVKSASVVVFTMHFRNVSETGYAERSTEIARRENRNGKLVKIASSTAVQLAITSSHTVEGN